MKIKVTQDDIDNGVKDNCKLCPVALAIKRICSVLVRVYDFTIIIGNSEFGIPNSVYQFIDNFDTGRAVEPFEFELIS